MGFLFYKIKMQHPDSFYNNQNVFYQDKIKATKQQLVTYSLLRLFIFLGVVLGIYFSFSQWQLASGIAIFGVIVFLALLSKYTDVKANLNLSKALLQINKDEIRIRTEGYHWKANGRAFQEDSHYYSLDLDLFGKASFFQYLDRTAISEGQLKLAQALKANDTESIESRQKAIKELSQHPKWQQSYTANASLIQAEASAADIVRWIGTYTSFLPKHFKWLPLAFSLGSLALLLLTVFEIIGVALLGYWLLIGLAVTGAYLKQINKLAFNTSKAKDTFRQYAVLLDLIEQQEFNSELLNAKQQQIGTDLKTASEIFKTFSKALDALDNRNNLISAILGNGYFLWDIMQSYKIEQWIKAYGDKVEDWFEVVSFFDAYISLGTFAFNHQDYTYPIINTSGNTIEADNLGHPLLPKSKRVTSNLTIKKEEFFIITGANMAGKSTFLRTVALHIVMANMGLPVCAKTSHYHPIKLITSMRTSDSLADESSYFFSELTRLKFIVDAIKEERYFIILDEILKGTNSTDKAIGSRRFVEQLVGAKATGIIATHDLSLCEIEAELDPVKNYYFDAEIINDELYFDYKLKQGVCKNMNASFLLKKMEIIN